MQQNNFRVLNKLQSSLFMLGGVLMVAGMGCFVLMFQQYLAAVTFLVGAVLFAIMQTMQGYTGTDVTLRRLKSIMNMADLLFVLAGILMVDSVSNFMRPMFNNQEHYIQFVYNKWLVLLMIAVVLEVYTMHRISFILKKIEKTNNDE